MSDHDRPDPNQTSPESVRPMRRRVWLIGRAEMVPIEVRQTATPSSIDPGGNRPNARPGRPRHAEPARRDFCPGGARAPAEPPSATIVGA